MKKLVTVMLVTVFIISNSMLIASGSKTKSKLKASEKMGWKLGVQAWTFHQQTFFQAIDHAKQLGLKYIEAFPGQKVSADMGNVGMGPDLTAVQMVAIKKKLKDSGITLDAFGVCNIGSTEQAARKTFEFAKKMGIQVLVSEPKPEDFTMLDKLANEYKIKIALHNHPKNSRYWNPDIVLKAVKGHSKMIGSCSDIGHWVRSGLDPMECLKKLEGRIVSFHMKDMNKKARDCHDVPWGTGICNTKAIMAEMKRQGFKGPVSIEYEYNWGKSMPELKKCVKFFEKTAAKMVKKGKK